jgi:hypothetical protein
MGRLIDSQTAYDVLTDYYHHSTDTQHAALREALGRVESVDAVPVVHGEWVWVQYDANPEIGNFHCSKCRFIPATFNMINKQLNFCPNCGAKMDGKDGDGNG